MAKKRPLVEDPPSASSEEKEDASSEEESEDEQPAPQKPPAVSSAAAKKSKSKSKTPVSVPHTESKKSRKKQKSDGGDPADADVGTERKLFQRVWSEEDEVVMLQGMIDYAEKHGKYPIGDMGDFHDSIKKSIQAEGFSKTQLNDKIRRLKKKYRNNAARAKYNPTKAHDQKVFLLSKKIWGEGGGAPAEPKRVLSARGGAAVDPATLKEVLSHLPESLVERGLELLSEDTKAHLLDKWNNIFVAEVEIVSKRNALLSELTACILEAFKK